MSDHEDRPRPYFIAPPTRGLGMSIAATPPAPLTTQEATDLLVPRPAGELELARSILARMLTSAAAEVRTAADGSHYLDLYVPAVDLTAAEAAYLEELTA
jgi:hypothetical protein